MNAPRYDSYRDSGIDWLGSVPNHWKIDRLKASVASSKGGIWGEEADGGEEDIACIRVADFRRRDFSVSMDDPTVRKIAAKDRHGRLVSRGNLLLEKSGGGEKQPVGAVSLYDHDVPAVCSNFVTRLELAAGMHPSFWCYVHAAAYDRGLTFRSLNQTSGIQNLDQARYLDECAAYPPLAEQAAIAAFLDRETSKIDALVEAQTRLIELLKEKRQAVISHAVTKGLDPAAPMKDSGVEWLGQVPAHWGQVPLRRVVRQFVDYRGVTPQKLSDGIPLITATQIKNGRIDHNLDPVFISEDEYVDRMTRGFPAVGDLLLTTEAPLGEVALVEDERIAPGQRMILMKMREQLMTSRYLHAHFRSDFGQSELWTRASGSTASGIRADRLRSSAVLVPPLNEQRLIVEHIERETKTFEQVFSVADATITLLQERRAALISAAVTGKIDVRGIVREQAEAA